MNKTVLAVVDDMIFAAKIRAVAQAIEVNVRFPRSKESAIAEVKAMSPEVIVVDLHGQRLDPLELARELKADATTQQSMLLGFYSHVETRLKNDALGAGYDQVVPRSVFVRDLEKILAGE